MALDPTEHSVRELRDEAQDVDDPAVIEEAIEIEQSKDDPRVTAIDTLEARLNSLEDDDDAGTAGAGQGRSSASSPTRRA